jgi:hypothetical protein
MLDPNVILIVGALSATGAVTCGAKAIHAHVDQVRHEGIGAMLRHIFDETVAEPVPDDLRGVLDRLPEDK